MTAAAVAAPMSRRSTGVPPVSASPLVRRQVRVRVTATTAPDVRRAHPAAPSRRPGGAPAPALRRGAIPEQLRPAAPVAIPSQAARTTPWRLTDRAIGLIMAVVFLLVLTSVAVVVGKAIQVTSPDSVSAVTR